VALLRLDERMAQRELPQAWLVPIEWKLGRLPDADCIAYVRPSWVSWELDEFSLAGEEQRYQLALPELRHDVRRNWLALALLRDEGSVPELCRWLLDADSFDGGHALTALGMIGSRSALEALYACTTWRHPEKVLLTLAEVEDPDRLGRLAVMTRDPARSSAAKTALVLALARG
jgi:hypothetical protein